MIKVCALCGDGVERHGKACQVELGAKKDILWVVCIEERG